MPGNRYVQVVNTYLTRRLLITATLGAVCVSLLPITVWWLSGASGSVDRSHSYFGFFLAFPAMFLGIHLKQQLACPEARLVPGYRAPHLIVAALTVLIPILFAVMTAPAVDGSIMGHAALLVMVCLVFFHGMADPNRLTALGFVAVYLPLFVAPLRIAAQQVLAGHLPGLTWCLLSAEVAIGILLFHRLANLTEDDPAYGNVVPLNSLDMRAAEARRRNRAQLQKSPGVLFSLIEAESRRLDRLTADRATDRRRRVALLQMAGDWPINLTSMVLMMILMEATPLLIIYSTGNRLFIATEVQFAKALSWPIMLSLMILWVNWLPQSQRWSRLGYEQLRPSARGDWVLENGLAFICNSARLQMAWLLVQAFLLFIFLPAFVTSPAIVNGLIFLVGMQVLMFGAGAWVSSFGSMFWKVVAFIIVISFLQPSWLAVHFWSLSFGWQIPVIAIILAAVGVVMAMIAYRRWCRIDLT